jgi:hypothetical protein
VKRGLRFSSISYLVNASSFKYYSYFSMISNDCLGNGLSSWFWFSTKCSSTSFINKLEVINCSILGYIKVVYSSSLLLSRYSLIAESFSVTSSYSPIFLFLPFLGYFSGRSISKSSYTSGSKGDSSVILIFCFTFF